MTCVQTKIESPQILMIPQYKFKSHPDGQILNDCLLKECSFFKPFIIAACSQTIFVFVYIVEVSEIKGHAGICVFFMNNDFLYDIFLSKIVFSQAPDVICINLIIKI